LSPQVRAQLQRVTAHLLAAIRRRGFSRSAVRRRLGWGRCRIRQALEHQRPLRFADMLEILDLLGIEPADFFAELVRTWTAEEAAGENRELARLIDRLRPGADNGGRTERARPIPRCDARHR
jgi:hypothetical protein